MIYNLYKKRYYTKTSALWKFVGHEDNVFPKLLIIVLEYALEKFDWDTRHNHKLSKTESSSVRKHTINNRQPRKVKKMLEKFHAVCFYAGL